VAERGVATGDAAVKGEARVNGEDDGDGLLDSTAQPTNKVTPTTNARTSGVNRSETCLR
jgi:hypothetical protein